jgi:hypothetical protein
MHFDTYVIMPNHVHFLVQLKHNQHYVPRHLIGKVFRRMSRSIPSFIAAIKRICTIRVRIHHNRPHMRVWQANYHNSIAPPPTSALSGTTSTTIHAMHTTRRTRHFCITIHLITRVDHKDAS